MKSLGECEEAVLKRVSSDNLVTKPGPQCKADDRNNGKKKSVEEEASEYNREDGVRSSH